MIITYVVDGKVLRSTEETREREREREKNGILDHLLLFVMSSKHFYVLVLLPISMSTV